MIETQETKLLMYELDKFEEENRNRASLIIVSPKIWYNFTKNVFDYGHYGTKPFENKTTFRGIRVIRSLDIDENEIIVK
jgi:hypothetical protein